MFTQTHLSPTKLCMKMKASSVQKKDIRELLKSQTLARLDKLSN